MYSGIFFQYAHLISIKALPWWMGFHLSYLPKMFWLLSAGHVISRPWSSLSLHNMQSHLLLKMSIPPSADLEFVLLLTSKLICSGCITTMPSPSPRHHWQSFLCLIFQPLTQKLSIFLEKKSLEITQELFALGEELASRFPTFLILIDKMKHQFVYTRMVSHHSNSHSPAHLAQ